MKVDDRVHAFLVEAENWLARRAGETDPGATRLLAQCRQAIAAAAEPVVGLDEALRLLAAIQPDDAHVHRARYDHGGGRMYRELPDGRRSLILDVYEHGDREFYFNAARLVRALLGSACEDAPPVGAR
jgi:hypothetical protein